MKIEIDKETLSEKLDEALSEVTLSWLKKMEEEEKEQRRYPKGYVCLNIHCSGMTMPFEETMREIPKDVWENINNYITSSLREYVNMQGDVRITMSTGFGEFENYETLRERKSQ